MFVSTSVHAREIEMPDGSVHTFYFKELPAVEFRKFHIAETSQDDEVKALSMAKLISAAMTDADGKPVLTLADAKRLNGHSMSAFMTAVLDVNGFGKKEKNG